jgi:hypothetical protein
VAEEVVGSAGSLHDVVDVDVSSRYSWFKADGLS